MSSRRGEHETTRHKESRGSLGPRRQKPQPITQRFPGLYTEGADRMSPSNRRPVHTPRHAALAAARIERCEK